MFQNIRYRLLLSYLLIFASILSVFSLGVRLFFAHSLKQQIIDKLIVLGQSVIASAEWENNQLKIDSDFRVEALLNHHQSLQWFNLQGKILYQQGKIMTNLPFSQDNIRQIQEGKSKIQTVTLPIIDSDNGKLIGYLRVSQSLAELDEILEKLDWGLGIGIVVALVFSGVGGILLTNQAMIPIEDSFQRLKQFTADASHEFRSPLMAIQSNVSVSLKYSEGMRETDQESFKAIASATYQLTHLTEDLLLLARSEKNNLSSQEEVNLNTVMEELGILYQCQCASKNIKLTIVLNELLLIIGDRVQLSRLFSNLIENALHYTSEGGLIKIKGKRKGSLIEIQIQDTGVGIESQYLGQIFERFWRADTSRSYWHGGCGLGLSIVKAITENHGGTSTVISQLGIGSCFTVCLPMNLSSNH
ncbi:HAMP domain-containing histidine kinase [Geminocystis sp. GBBB08]|uniref:sensor histidine kinase n=1 Tax=Geminocystis sp. GBBB08 TaxID=2604140 RepID=UPI0027E2750C|nr:HAMP domain-containing histidine kinase [Geminocystis sp. GBBB08]MBL1210026.1 HAMP domain-containing histidine kinase [Geminocystis sp. GBBB08]